MGSLNEATVLELLSSGQQKYDDYLASPEGRLRLELSWSNLSRHLDGLSGSAARRLTILDAGCGTGEVALRLAERGHRVCLLDLVPEMLRRAREKFAERQLIALADFHEGSLAAVAQLFPAASFDAVVCHTVLEYVAEPESALAGLAACLRPGGLVSLLFRNRYGEALKLIVRDQQFETAFDWLRRREFQETMFGLSGHLFAADEMRRWWEAAGLRVVAEYGVRALSDYLPAEAKAGESNFARLFELEEKLSVEPPYRQIARYIQMIGVKSEELRVKRG
jgi:S-adenosylmethionine-dependent methyltransferase